MRNYVTTKHTEQLPKKGCAQGLRPCAHPFLGQIGSMAGQLELLVFWRLN